MKKYRILLFLFLCLTLLFASTQVLASPASLTDAKTTRTPGAKATEKADDKPNKQPDKLNDNVKQADKPQGKYKNFKGTVTALDLDSITLTLRDGSSVTIGLTADTRMKFPGSKKSAPRGIQPGMTAMVQAIHDANGDLVARSVMVIPGKPNKVHRVGIVTEYTEGSSITIQDKDGNTFTFAITSETKLLPAERAETLEVGSRATIIAPRDPASGGVKVKGIVIHPAKP